MKTVAIISALFITSSVLWFDGDGIILAGIIGIFALWQLIHKKKSL